MQAIKYVHWQEGESWLGHLEDYPDYWSQAETQADLVEHLKDLYHDLSGGHIPGARKVDRAGRLHLDTPWRQAQLVSQSENRRFPTNPQTSRNQGDACTTHSSAAPVLTRLLPTRYPPLP